MIIEIKRGDILFTDLSGASGGEKQNDLKTGGRPCVVVQNDIGKRFSPMTIVVPLTDGRQFKGLPVQVQVKAAELGDGAVKDGVIECGHIRTVDKIRILKHLGTLHANAMARVDAALQVSLGVKEVDA